MPNRADQHDRKGAVDQIVQRTIIHVRIKHDQTVDASAANEIEVGRRPLAIVHGLQECAVTAHMRDAGDSQQQLRGERIDRREAAVTDDEADRLRLAPHQHGCR